MTIITPGSLPPPPVYTGTCKSCGCVVEEVLPNLKVRHCPVYEKWRWWDFFLRVEPTSYVKWYHLTCPTEFCGRKIRMNPVDQT